MNEMLRYTIIRVILFVMGGFLVLGCSDEDDVGNSGGTSKYGLIRMAEEDYDSSNTSLTSFRMRNRTRFFSIRQSENSR